MSGVIDRDVLAAHIHRQLGMCVHSVTPFREGAEFTVFRALMSPARKVVLKAAPREDMSNANDPSCSARALLRQEEELGRYLRSRGIPVPISLGLVTDGPYPCLLQEFVEHDETCEVSDDHLAHLLSRIHACTAPRTLVAHEGLPFASCIARRITRRAHELEKATGASLPVPDATRIKRVLKLRGCRPSLLHMDIRPPNILATAGSIRAIIDWSNALMGDPALEFARIAEWWRPCTRLRVAYENIRGPMRTPRNRRPSLSARRGSGAGASALPRAAQSRNGEDSRVPRNEVGRRCTVGHRVMRSPPCWRAARLTTEVRRFRDSDSR